MDKVKKSQSKTRIRNSAKRNSGGKKAPINETLGKEKFIKSVGYGGTHL
jgi:hypothetical protein